jgi:hypothetical protein
MVESSCILGVLCVVQSTCVFRLSFNLGKWRNLSSEAKT